MFAAPHNAPAGKAARGVDETGTGALGFAGGGARFETAERLNAARRRFPHPPRIIRCERCGGQPAELARLTCGQLADLPRAEGERLIVWLHGYYAGAAQKPSLDGGQFETAMQAVRETCTRNRALPLIGAEARGIFLGTAPPPAAAAPERSAAPAPRRPAWEEPRRPAPLR